MKNGKTDKIWWRVIRLCRNKFLCLFQWFRNETIPKKDNIFFSCRLDNSGTNQLIVIKAANVIQISHFPYRGRAGSSHFLSKKSGNVLVGRTTFPCDNPVRISFPFEGKALKKKHNFSQVWYFFPSESMVSLYWRCRLLCSPASKSPSKSASYLIGINFRED